MAQWVHHEEIKTIFLLQMLTSAFPKQTLMLTVSPLFRPLASALSPVQKPNPSHHQPQTPWAVVCNPRTSPRSQWCHLALKGVWLGLIDLRCLWSLALVSHKSLSQSPETTETALSFHPSYGNKPDKANPKMVWQPQYIPSLWKTVYQWSRNSSVKWQRAARAVCKQLYWL